jgi:hypothetical protein
MGLVGAFIILPFGGIRTEEKLSTTGNAAISGIALYPNIETMGVVVNGASLPATAQLMFQQAGETVWRTGHPLKRIDDGRLVGSLFGLAPSTSYNVMVSDGSTELIASATTQPDALAFTPSLTLYVNDDAPAGGNGSASAPFRTIQEAVNLAAPGTQILVSDGVYREAVSFPASGTPGNWIQVRAEGNAAILDGADTISGSVWTPVVGKSNLWFTRLAGPIGYLARDGRRYYRYDDYNDLLNGNGHNNVPMPEGWHFDAATVTLYVRSLDDPSRHVWQAPRFNHAFDVVGRDWIWIEGFEMRFYGTLTDGCGVCTLNASHVVIRRNRIHNMQLGVFINWNGNNAQGNDARVEFNEVFDPPVNEWPWNAVKGSSMEGTGIVVRGHIGAIVRGNDIHNYFNGIYTGISGTAGENPAIAFDADIYNNRIHQISDDGLEPEGAGVNHRFRNNSVDRMLAGISLAPITVGPTWVMRSTFTNYTSKAVKWDRNSDGIVLMYHNTAWTNSPDASGMELISPVRNTTLRNNIFQMNGFAIIERPAGSANNDWNNNNWYSTRTSSNPHFKWENVNYDRIRDFCRATGLECNGYDSAPGFVNPGGGDFSLLGTSPNVNRGVLIPGINDVYDGTAPDIGAFELGISTPPTQTPIPSAIPSPTMTSTLPPPTQPSPTETPTIGLPTVLPTPSLTPFPIDPPPTVLAVSRADTSPTAADTVRFRVTFSEFVTGVDMFPPVIDFGLGIGGGITGATITAITPESGSSYLVQVNTGSGSGTIQLYVADDDSIRDSLGQPLGGVGGGNGNFTTGEVYTINKVVSTTYTASFTSNGGSDGWVMELKENTEIGGYKNSGAATFILGDEFHNRQYRSILQFQTAPLPDNAVVTRVTLMIRSAGIVGTNPFQTHQYILVDIAYGAFGTTLGGYPNKSLQYSDFQAPSSRDIVGVIQNNPFVNWYWTNLDPSAYPFINLTGTTQFRLRFQLDDDDDQSDDFIKFYSGDYSSAGGRPQLLVEYYLR